ncbi:restriction endonuclease subunit S [Williamsia sp. 1135]|uniref:restriction endonuclease subunit S n=1 Tax=Williamsia sp. 1135 TaxID=1889262 RepID=UPI000A117FB2|nr:restriction endonuclease subunit S [Williamsia sp. 1135]ORM26885.1 hypothetical protein BFL43_22740 [Williamsia sp. 1135]
MTTGLHNSTPLRRLADCWDHLRVPLNAEERHYRPGDVPYWGANSIQGHVDTPLVSEEVVLVGEDGAPFFDRDRPVAFRVAEPIWPNNHIHVLKPRKRVDARWLAYALNDVDYSMYVIGSTRDKLTQSALMRILLPTTGVDKQRAIADFLDRETARIDTLIEEQKRLIELLRERRAATITAATEKGALVTFGRVVTRIRQGTSPNCEAWPGDGVIDWAVLKVGCSNTGRFRPSQNKRLPDGSAPIAKDAVHRGEIVMSRANTRELVGCAAVVQGNYPRLLLSDLTYGITVGRDVDPQYVAYSLASSRARWAIAGMAKGSSPSMQKISQRDVRDVLVHIPPLQEQRRVVALLDDQTAKIDSLIAETEKFIELSRERRSALIAAAVTGQIDVRESA